MSLLGAVATDLVQQLRTWLATPVRDGLLSAADKAWIDEQRAVPLLLSGRQMSGEYEAWSAAEGPLDTVIGGVGSGAIVCALYVTDGGLMPMHEDGFVQIEFGVAPSVTRFQLVSYSGMRPGHVLISCAADAAGPWSAVADVDVQAASTDTVTVRVSPELRLARVWRIAATAGDAWAMIDVQMWGALS